MSIRKELLGLNPKGQALIFAIAALLSTEKSLKSFATLSVLSSIHRTFYVIPPLYQLVTCRGGLVIPFP